MPDGRPLSPADDPVASAARLAAVRLAAVQASDPGGNPLSLAAVMQGPAGPGRLLNDRPLPALAMDPSGIDKLLAGFD